MVFNGIYIPLKHYRSIDNLIRSSIKSIFIWDPYCNSRVCQNAKERGNNFPCLLTQTGKHWNLGSTKTCINHFEQTIRLLNLQHVSNLFWLVCIKTTWLTLCYRKIPGVWLIPVCFSGVLMLFNLFALHATLFALGKPGTGLHSEKLSEFLQKEVL